MPFQYGLAWLFEIIYFLCVFNLFVIFTLKTRRFKVDFVAIAENGCYNQNIVKTWEWFYEEVSIIITCVCYGGWPYGCCTD